MIQGDIDADMFADFVGEKDKGREAVARGFVLIS
jgi:hypothetical protein